MLAADEGIWPPSLLAWRPYSSLMGRRRKRYCPSDLPLRSIPPTALCCSFAEWSQAVLSFGPSASLHPPTPDRVVMPESRFTDATAPFVNQAGQFVTGMPVGMAGHGLMQAGTQAADAAKRYADGLLDRGAEIVLRTGDDAQSLTGNLAEQFGSKKTWRYLLDPKADPNLAYQLPWGYSGETTDLHDAHYGDMIDKFLRKVPIQGASYDQSELPQFLRDYIAKNYPGKKIPIVHLGEARSRFRFDNNDASTRLMLENMPVGSSIIPPEGVSSASVKIPDRTINNGSIVDPGGFRMVVTRTPDGFLLDNWDIWKFLPDDYAPRYMKNNTPLQRLRNKYGL